MIGVPSLPLAGFGSFVPRLFVRKDEIDVTDAQCTRKLEDGYDGRIASTAFKITDVLLGKAGQFGELLLREALMLPQSCEIPTDQLAHVHARKLWLYIL